MNPKNTAVGLAIIIIVAILITTGIIVKGKGEAKDLVNPPAATYVGSKDCGECHDRIYATWQTTGHSQVIQAVENKPWIIQGNFKEPPYGAEMQPLDFGPPDVRYIHGINWKQRYIDENWLIRSAQWVYKDDKWYPYHQEDWKERNWLELCAACHVTGFNPETLEFKEPSVGCENCHGPGSNHIDAPDAFKNNYIKNPSKMSFNASASVCGSCHIRGKVREGFTAAFPIGFEIGDVHNGSFFPPIPPDDKHWWPNGSASGHHQQYMEWKTSRHGLAGIDCTNCHDPHASTTRTATKLIGNSLCLSCHSNVSTDSVTGHAPIAGAPQHVNCIACHYPKTAKSALPFDISSHGGFIPPSETVKWTAEGKKQPNSCNLCHAHADITVEENDPQYLQDALDEGQNRLEEMRATL